MARREHEKRNLDIILGAPGALLLLHRPCLPPHPTNTRHVGPFRHDVLDSLPFPHLLYVHFTPVFAAAGAGQITSAAWWQRQLAYCG